MLKKLYLLNAAAAILLAGCGGGGDDTCAGKTAFVSLRFDPSDVTLHIGKPATIASKFEPESCRGDASFSVKSGALPEGMKLVNGNVEGTPTTQGQYSFRISVDFVRGYKDFSSQPNSNVVNVKVAP